jgi:hypothetical protein
MAALAPLLVLLGVASVSLAGRPKVEGVQPDEVQAGIPVARVFGTGPGVEAFKAKRWSPLPDNSFVRTGDHLRTGGGAAAAIQFPWTTLIVSPGTTLSVPPSIVLTAALEEGRVEQRAIGEDIIKLRTPEAVVRGSGHVIVRRHNGRTYVSAVEGTFDVATGPGTLRLEGGNGTIVVAGERPSTPKPLVVIGEDMHPGVDPVYFRKAEAVRLRWGSPATQHHVQVLVFDSDQIVYDGDVPGAQYSLPLPIGMFRWHVSAAGPDAPDGKPSPDGFICVVED